MRFISSGQLCRPTAAIVLLSCLTASVCAYEPIEPFVKGLRERGLHDFALKYLDRVEFNPHVLPSEKKSLLLYRGQTLVEQALLQGNLQQREQGLQTAEKALNDFLKNNKDRQLALSAESQLGNVIIERARIRMKQAERANVSGEEKRKFHVEAKSLFSRGRKKFLDHKATIAARLKDIPKSLDPTADAETIRERDQLRADYVQSQLVAATVQYEMSSALKNDRKAYEKTLNEAAVSYAEIAEKYRRRLAGLYAIMYGGRCYQDLGDHKKALGNFTELLDQPDDPQALRDLKTKSLVQAIQSWLTPSQKQYELAIEQGEAWLQKQRPTEKRNEDWLAVRLMLAKSYFASIEQAPDKRTRDSLTQNARSHASIVAKRKGDSQREAQELLTQLGRRPSAPITQPDSFENFADAWEASKQIVGQLQVSSSSLKILRSRLPQVEDAAGRAEISKQIQQITEQEAGSRQKALQVLTKALALGSAGADDIEVTELNQVRYYLSIMHYQAGDYYDAAVLGEFMARYYPNSGGSRSSAQVALQAYLQIYKQSSAELRAGQTERITQLADLIATQWPGKPEADEALKTLVSFMVREGQLAEAQAYLERIPADSPQRGSAELSTGQALWAKYLAGMRQAAATGDQDKQPELDELKKQAQQTLASGINRLKQRGLSATLARSALSLVQIYVDSGETENAIALLEDPAIGPQTLVNKQHPVAKSAGFATETHKAAIRAYVSAVPGANNPDAMIRRATEEMAALKKSVGDSAESQKRLIAIYVSLARELQQQIELAPAQARTALSAGFETFLGQAGQSSNDFGILNWVAATYYGLASGFDQGAAAQAGKAPAEAVKYYEQALAFYRKILTAKQSGSLQVDSDSELQIQLRIAMTLRRLDEFGESMQMFVDMLTEKPGTLNIQIEAARTLQMWGDAGQHDKYRDSIVGAYPIASSGKNAVWGWGRLAKATSRNEKFRQTFYDARYNLAVSRLKQAMSASGPDREKGLRLAARDVTMTVDLFPPQPNSQIEKKFQQLLQRIRRSKS